MPQNGIAELAAELRHELTGSILPFWITRTVDPVRGGFTGRITGTGESVPDADRGGILIGRILWTFSAAYRVLGERDYLRYADHAFREMESRFWDPVHGGVYWMLSAQGHPVDGRKHAYAQAFALYGLTEYVRATGSEPALRLARSLFDLLELHAYDAVHGGYREAFDRTWLPVGDVRLSDKDADAPRSMNTHLHILEALTNLCRVWMDERSKGRLRGLVELFLDRIVAADASHLDLFFDDDWSLRSSTVSFGHDIEASWLLREAAELLDDPVLGSRVDVVATTLARGVLASGVAADGSLLNERHAYGTYDDDRHWWPQAEALVGFTAAWESTGDARWLDAAWRVWQYVQRFMVDREYGEWHFRVDRAGRPYREEDKVGPWKCPYHSSRACIEVIERVTRGAGRAPASAVASRAR